jgi:hypothetical protein
LVVTRIFQLTQKVHHDFETQWLSGDHGGSRRRTNRDRHGHRWMREQREASAVDYDDDHDDTPAQHHSGAGPERKEHQSDWGQLVHTASDSATGTD